MPADAVALVRAGEPFTLVDEDLGVRWQVHPFLFDVAEQGQSDPRTVETRPLPRSFSDTQS